MVEVGRRLWNDALAHRKRRWEKRLSTSYNQQCRIFTVERRADPQLRELYAQAGQEILKRLERAFQSFFDGRSKYPKFKKFSQSGSFSYPQAYNGSVKPDPIRKRLFLSRVGNVKAVFHRGIPTNDRLKTCTVIRESNGEWYASLVYDDGAGAPFQTIRFESPVGVDLGLKSLITTIDWVKIPHPQFLRKAEKRLKYLQRNLSKTKRGSSRREKKRRLVAIKSAKVTRQRADFNHKLSAELVRKHDLISFEDLKVKNMVKNRALAKSIADAGWNQLRTFSEYKAGCTGKLVVMVPPGYSTQECFFCGALNRVSLKVRIFDCRGCAKTLDRDFNAAWIVLKRGLAQVGQGMPELKPVEKGPLRIPPTEWASPFEEAGTKCGENHATQHRLAAGSPRPSVVGGCHSNLRESTR